MKKRVFGLLILFLALMMIGSTFAEGADFEISFEEDELDVVADDVDDVVLEVDDLFLGEVEPFEEVGDIALTTYNAEPAMSNAAVVANSDDDFEIINGILVGYNGEGGDITIPNSVTAIGSCAFSSLQCIKSISIPESVKSISDNAFAHCHGLTSITIPNSVTIIGVGAFFDCSNLISVTLPNRISCIEYGVFEDCSSMTTITIPNSVNKIEYNGPME